MYGKGHADAEDLVCLLNGDLLAELYGWLAVHSRGEDPEAPFPPDFRSNAEHVGM